MKNPVIWLMAVVITVAAAYYQRKTGPTYPKKVSFETGGQSLSTSLPRSHETDEACPVKVIVPGREVTGMLLYRTYPSSGTSWDSIPMTRKEDTLIASLPAQPPAGKLSYVIALSERDREIILPAEEPVIIRYKGSVPAYILIPHIFFMFFAMLLSSATGLMAIWKKPRYRLYARITLIFLFIGGGILGPLVQKYAFGALWTGIPFGWDLTDNKTLIALFMWTAAVIMNRNKQRYGWVIAAAVTLLLVYSVPHSMFGSEFNYETGEIIQGMITPFLI